MKTYVLGLALIVVGCVDSLDDLEGTDCKGSIPSKIKVLDPVMQHDRPCSVAEAVAYERAQSADMFRANNAGVLCLLEEATVECAEEEGDERILFVCETSHPAPDLDFIFPMTSVVVRADDCPE